MLWVIDGLVYWKVWLVRCTGVHFAWNGKGTPNHAHPIHVHMYTHGCLYSPAPKKHTHISPLTQKKIILTRLGVDDLVELDAAVALVVVGVRDAAQLPARVLVRRHALYIYRKGGGKGGLWCGVWFGGWVRGVCLR